MNKQLNKKYSIPCELIHLLHFLTSLVLLMETMKSKNGSSPARCPGEFS